MNGHYKPCKEHECYIGSVEFIQGCYFCLSEENEKLQAEVKQLRDAIEYAIEICGPCEGDGISSATIKENVIEHLQQALKGGE